MQTRPVQQHHAAAFCAVHKRRRRRRKRKPTQLGAERQRRRANAGSSLSAICPISSQRAMQIIICQHTTAAKSQHLKVSGNARVDHHLNQRVSPAGIHESSSSEMERRASRPKRPAARASRQVLKIASSAIILLTMQLICDTGRPLAHFVAGSPRQAASDSEASEPAAATPTDTQTFLLEPRDTLASVGQRRELTCVISAQLNTNARLMWFRHKTIQLTNELELKLLGSRYAVTKEPVDARQLAALANGQQLKQPASKPPNNGQQLAAKQEKPVGIKYSLVIKSVALDDNAEFHCVLDDDQTQFVSRQARLSVLAPPTRLDIRDLRAGPPAATSTTFDDSSANQQDANESAVQTIEVRQNALVELECRSNFAKPHAELTWLDENQQLVPSLSSQQARLSLEPPDNETIWIAAQSYTEQFVRLNDTGNGSASGPLEETRLVWSFRARREQHMKLLTCMAGHKAFALAAQDELEEPAASSRRTKLERVVQLSVLYEPEVELTREPLQPHEFGSLRFHCNAHARPSQMQYSWFLDEQLVANASEPELYVPVVTRQLHLREIRCQVANAIGRTSANATRLAIKYSPAYVTHLLPASLQPDYLAQASHTRSSWPSEQLDGAGAETSAASEQLPVAQERADEASEEAYNFRRLFEQLDQRVVAELAVGVSAGATAASLRCDFDSNPQPLQVHWFKVNTEYSSMRDVTPDDANELIAMGASRAYFAPARGAARRPQAGHNNSKRHISIEQMAPSMARPHLQPEELDEDELEVEELPASANANPSAPPRRHELDFERMSSELLSEMAFLEQEQRRLATNQSEPLASDSKFIETIPGEQILPASQTIVTIEEPLEFKMIARRASQSGGRLGSLQRNNNSSAMAANRLAAGKELVLLDSPAPVQPLRQQWVASGASASREARKMQPSRMNGRQAQLTSSTLELRHINADSIGKYICKARAQPGFNSTAKAVFLVLRSRPRIISASRQAAPMGANQLQVECLVQINTVQDNQTTVKWFRHDKLIGLDHKFGNVPQSLKNVTIIKEMSPDALFIRSTLRISGADRGDFGTYRCVASNSLGEQDTMFIELESVPTADVLRLLVISMFGLIGCLLTVFGLIFMVDSCSLIDKASLVSRKKKAAAANDDVKKTSDSAAAAAASSQLSAKNQMSQADSVSSNQSISSNQLNGSKANFDFGLDHGRVQRPGSAFSASHLHSNGMHASSTGSFRLQAGQRTCSFRGPIGSQQEYYRQQQRPANFSQQTPASRFAAIHETLEHKLQLQPNVNGQQQQQRGSTSSASTAACHEEAHEQLALEQNCINQQHAIEAAAAGAGPATGSSKASFIERLRARFAGESAAAAVGQQERRARSRFASGKRPVISMPLASGTSLKRSSLSNSLTLVGEEMSPTGGLAVSSPGARQPAAGKQFMMMHLNQLSGEPESALVSSSANLIQDNSTTNSDGAASSGRSSSTSNANQPHQMHFQPQRPPPVGPRPQHIGWLPGSSAVHRDSSGLYANGAYDTGASQLYANEHLQYSSANYAQPIGLWPAQATIVEEQQQQKQQMAHDQLNGHYQMPMLMSEPYLAQLVNRQQLASQNRPTYASICTQASSLAATNNAVDRKQQFLGDINMSRSSGGSNGTGAAEMTNGHCGALAVGLVPTSDGGEAFFESHYGSLLASHAGSYNTLGYATSHPLHSTDSAGSSNSNCSSGAAGGASPANSLATHANLLASSQLAPAQFASRHLDDNDNELSTPRPQHHHHLQQQPIQHSPLECATNLTNDSPGQQLQTAPMKQQQQQVQLESIRADLATHV